jgi:hypothetical protein
MNVSDGGAAGEFATFAAWQTRLRARNRFIDTDLRRAR